MKNGYTAQKKKPSNYLILEQLVQETSRDSTFHSTEL